MRWLALRLQPLPARSAEEPASLTAIAELEGEVMAGPEHWTPQRLLYY